MRMAVGGLAVLGTVAALIGIGASASADQAYFCPSSGTQVYIGGGGECHGGGVGNLVRVYAATVNGDGVSHCAIGKQQSDGGGANVIPSQCGTSQYQITGCYSARLGYPKILNQSSSAHYFHGDFDYATCLH